MHFPKKISLTHMCIYIRKGGVEDYSNSWDKEVQYSLITLPHLDRDARLKEIIEVEVYQ